MKTSPEILIVGAGPAGLTAAAEAIRHGVSVRIIDRNESRSIYSKALVVHSRSLEIFHDMGFVEDVLHSGQKFQALNIYAETKSLTRIIFQDLDWQDAIFPYWLSLPQSETERCLEEHLQALGGSVERCTGLVGLEQFSDHVRVTLKKSGNATEVLDVPWVVACDGAHSLTRELLGLDLRGRAENELFILGDVLIDWEVPEDEGNMILTEQGLVLIVPMPELRRYRIIAHMPEGSIADPPEITLPFLQDLVDRRTPFTMRLSDLTWRSSFSSKHFVVSEHRQGRVFLAGDAAHIHSPVGGQGLNSGIQDAYNLIWKLALVHRGQALPSLLDSYARERHKTARSLITNVGTATKLVTLKSPLARKLRDRLAGLVLNTGRVRNRMGRGVAMLDIAYRDSPVVAQDLPQGLIPERALAGLKRLFTGGRHASEQPPSAGMRAPNVIMADDGADPPASLFDLYRGTHFTLLIFTGIRDAPDIEPLVRMGAAIRAGYQAPIQYYVVTVEAPPHLPDPAHVLLDARQSLHRAYGAREPSIYMIRPDKYIAYRSQDNDQGRLAAYLDRTLTRHPLDGKE